MVALMNYLVPKKKYLVLHSYPDVEDQLVAVLRWMQSNPEERLPTTLLVGGDEKQARRWLRKVVGPLVDHIEILNKTRPLAIWRYLRSRVVMFTHGLYGFSSVPPHQCVINLWHGMPTKTIWRAAPKKSRVPQCRYLLSTSDTFSNILANVSNLARKRILPIGLPRNDTLLVPGPNADSFKRTILNGATNLIIFLPTYRTSKKGYLAEDGEEAENALMMSELEMNKLSQTLHRCDAVMLVKPHPMSIHYGQNEQITERLRIISDCALHEFGVTLYDVLAICDLLITDISSVYIDFLVRRKPCLIYFPDLVSYRLTRNFLLNPIEHWVPNGIFERAVDVIEELPKVLMRGEDPSNDRLASILNPQSRPNACRNLWKVVQKELR